MTLTHNLGFPRIGLQRELKHAVEAYWQGEIDQSQLEARGRALRLRHWQLQAEAGVDLIPVGDFAWYDQMLDLSCLLGVVPARFSHPGGPVDLDTCFRMARGRAPSGEPAAACEMTKWFDTNYHYIVPEFVPGQRFEVQGESLFAQIREARDAGHRVKPVLPGPLTYLWLGKTWQDDFDKLSLLDDLLAAYGELLQGLRDLGVDWVQLDEPILVLDLPARWQAAFESAYSRLQVPGLKRLLATYFGELGDNLHLACRLPVDGLHVDAVRGGAELDRVLDQLPGYKVLSVGLIDGRNIWRNDLARSLNILQPLRQRLGERLWLAPSCSLLHCPVSLRAETKLPADLRSWLAFAEQKLDELQILRRALDDGREAVADALQAAHDALARRHVCHPPSLLAAGSDIAVDRPRPHAERKALQQARLSLPLLPTTTIGSFPQTREIRQIRARYRKGQLDQAVYVQKMQKEIAEVIRRQEAIGLDVLVHGEPERNDMVEYFGEQLEGFAFSENGWVQSYGSRCVKPPIIYGEVSRPAAMTVDWIRHAQALTEKPVKGMLTGPVTILNWSFVRDDQPRSRTCEQIALALREEVQDLERAGTAIIQIDEAALREGLPLRKRDWQHYLDWSIRAFRLTASGVRDDTQIHTHMCYSEFNDILPAIAQMDADVITIETSRSQMELLDAFEDFDYPNDIGPGVYDIHSPNVPGVEQIVQLMEQAMHRIPVEQLWINPDCGLKTRGWPEVTAALENMVEAARILRARAAVAA